MRFALAAFAAQCVTRLETTMAELADMSKILLAAQLKTEERFQQTGERIDKLVSAIGEFIRRMPPTGN